jgi:hypothetical protein
MPTITLIVSILFENKDDIIKDLIINSINSDAVSNFAFSVKKVIAINKVPMESESSATNLSLKSTISE